MPTVVQSCRLEKNAATLLARQARRRQLDVSTLTSLYLTEKTREMEFPGIGFRDHIGGREDFSKQACVLVEFWSEAAEWDWADRVQYLPR